MKERPIIFSAPMVRAILEGRKTQTRRIVKSSINYLHSGGNPVQLFADWPLSKLVEFDPITATAHFKVQCSVDDADHGYVKCPYGLPGDRLWVREAWAEFSGIEPKVTYVYRADGLYDTPAKEHLCDNRWRPSIHMPRAASRILLEITDISVERLMWLSEADAIAEGFRWGDWEPFGTPRETAVWAFSDMWEHLYGGGSWEQNPWVWGIEFKKIQP